MSAVTSGPKLPLIAERRAALETCAYCPKLCRAACPVSNAEPREALTPWGKMTTTWQMGRSKAPLDAAHAQLAWACTGCLACRERCDHRNPVYATLTDARADFSAAGLAPPAAVRSAERHGARRSRAKEQLEQLAALPGVDAGAPAALLLGCGYALGTADAARDAIGVATALEGRVRLLDACCGAPLGWAGARERQQAEKAELAARLRGARLLVADPGCALELSDLGATTLVELAASRVDRLGRVAGLDGPVRYSDPCALGRGLHRYDEPRALLARALGRPPDELPERREHAPCSGGGGLLPVTLPGVSAEIADRKLEAHRRAGGGTLVTACAASLRRLRSRGNDAVDLLGIVRRALDGTR